MRTLWSNTEGVIVHQDDDWALPTARSLINKPDWSSSELIHLTSVVDDWQIIDDLEFKGTAEDLLSSYWRDRATSLSLSLLSGLSDDLSTALYKEIESILQNHVQSKLVVSILCVAPLSDPESAQKQAIGALSDGFGATAALFEALHDLQPLLNRFTDIWLLIPTERFIGLQVKKEETWLDLVYSGFLTELLSIESGDLFLRTWGNYVFSIPKVKDRIIFGSIGKELSERLFPDIAQTPDIEELVGNSEPEQVDDVRLPAETGLSIHEMYLRNMSQVEAIAEAIAKGKERKARRFLNDLISSQQDSSNSIYTVKSLCNIAQQCADMFRTDFERECLLNALKCKKVDGWTLIQWGDHLKRTHQYNKALKAFEKAAEIGEQRVAPSCIADTWAQQEQYPKAIEMYKSIPNWENDLRVLTSLSDIYRRQGHLDKAELGYNKILEIWPDEHRALAGKAEVIKNRGNLPEAFSLYETILSTSSLDEHSSIIYRLAVCHILKLMDEYDKAYRVVDKIVQEYPFIMQARIQRASILGLLDNSLRALADIPESSIPIAYGEWLAQYFKGLLLFKLNRYDEAKLQLVDRLGEALQSGDSDTLVRLAAAFILLSSEEYEEADKILEDVRESSDYFTAYLHRILLLHLSVARDEKSRISDLLMQLQPAIKSSPTVEIIVNTIISKNLRLATSLELELFLKAA